MGYMNREMYVCLWGKLWFRSGVPTKDMSSRQRQSFLKIIISWVGPKLACDKELGSGGSRSLEASFTRAYLFS